MMKYILLIASFLCLGFLSAQTPVAPPGVDSLKRVLATAGQDTNRVKTLNKLLIALRETSPAEAMAFGVEAFNLAVQLKYSDGALAAGTRLGNYYKGISSFDKAKEYYQKCYDVSVWAPKSKAKFMGLNGLGLVHENLGEYDKAMTCFAEALTIAEQKKEGPEMTASLINLGLISFHMKDYPKAKEYYQKGIDLNEQLNNPKTKAVCLANLANVYIVESKYDSALIIYQQSIVIGDSLGDKLGVSSRLINVGSIYELQKKYPEAEETILRAIQLKEETGDLNGLAIAYHNLGKVFADINQFEKAEAYIRKGLEISKKIGATKPYMQGNKALSDLFKKKGDFKTAYDYLLVTDSLNEILFKEEKIKQVKDAEARYEATHKEQQIAMLSAGKVKDDQLLWQKNLLIGGLATLLGLLVAIGFLVWRQERLHVRRNALELEHRLLRAQMNPHFIFNAMQSIQRYIAENDLAKANEYMADLGVLIRKILEYTGKKTISLQEELDILQLYVNLEQARLNGIFEYVVEVSEEIDTFEVQVPPLVLQPFIENAIWHGIAPKKAAGLLRLVISQTGNQLLCEIEDDGIGLTASALRKAQSASPPRTSHGTAIARERLGGGDAVVMQERLKDDNTVAGTSVFVKIFVEMEE